MPKNKKHQLTFVLSAIALLGGCSVNDLSSGPSDKDILEVLKIKEARKSYGAQSTSICLQIPRADVSSVMGLTPSQFSWTAVLKENSKANVAQTKLDAFKSAGLLTAIDYEVYQKGVLVPATKYFVTPKGAQFLATSGAPYSSAPCFKAASVEYGNLIPGLKENGEKEKELIIKIAPEKMSPNALTYYQAWVEKKLGDQSEWLNNPEIQKTFNTELASTKSLDAVKVSVASYKNVWVPFELAVSLSAAEAQLAGATEGSEEMTKYRRKEFDSILEPYSSKKTATEAVPAEVQTQILQAASKLLNTDSSSQTTGLAGKTILMTDLMDTPSDLRAKNKVFLSNEPPAPQEALQKELDKILKADPKLAQSETVLDLKRKIARAADSLDSTLNKRKESRELLEALASHGFASKESISKSSKEYSSLAGKEGTLYTLSDELSSMGGYGPKTIKTVDVSIGKVLSSKQIKKVPASPEQNEQKSVELVVEILSTPIERTKELLADIPNLGKSYKKAVITATFTGNPVNPYKIQSIRGQE